MVPFPLNWDSLMPFRCCIYLNLHLRVVVVVVAFTGTVEIYCTSNILIAKIGELRQHVPSQYALVFQFRALHITLLCSMN